MVLPMVMFQVTVKFTGCHRLQVLVMWLDAGWQPDGWQAGDGEDMTAGTFFKTIKLVTEKP